MENSNASKKLLLVYNADSGVMNSLFDTGHKLLSPQTYSCNLCKLTYGIVSMKTDWKQFLDSLEADITFLHRDEFKKSYPALQVSLPAVFRITADDPELLIPSEEINKAHSLEELKRLLAGKLH